MSVKQGTEAHEANIFIEHWYFSIKFVQIFTL